MALLARIASALVAASFTLVPLSAMAADRAPAREHRQDTRFPMKADAYRAMMSRGIASMKTRIDARMKRLNIDAAKQAEVRTIVAAGVREIDAGIAKATADGVVTREEAREIRQASRKTYRNVREKIGHDKRRGEHVVRRPRTGRK